MKQYITFYTIPDTKLYLCKSIKYNIGIGLKESKDFIEHCSENLGIPMEIIFPSKESRDKLFTDITTNMPGFKFKITGDIQEERSRFFLEMEMGEKEDYVKFLSDNYMYLLYNRPIEEIKLTLNNIISKLDIDQLKNVYKEYCEKEESSKTEPKKEPYIEPTDLMW